MAQRSKTSTQENHSSARRKAFPQRWILSADPPQGQVEALIDRLRLSPVMARLLARRGLGNPDQADLFLNRKLDALHDPMKLPDMEKAVARIRRAIQEKQRILLFGDYDVDGVSATALMTTFFRVLRHPVVSLVPERTQGGYGLSLEALQRIRSHAPQLVITLDNGIGAHEAVATLNSDGVDTIVVDHHVVGEAGLPPALAVINPKRSDSSYPFQELCGAGLAFKLAWALAIEFSHSRKVSPEFKAFLLDAVALAALGTLADVVPLVDENRILAHHGLRILQNVKSPGLRALQGVCRMEPGKKLSATDVTFMLAPRINAAGRCGEAADALELLTTTDEARASELAMILERLNTERQGIEQRIHLEARTKALELLDQQGSTPALVLDAPDWHVGVIGIVASRLVEEFYRPTVLLAHDPQSNRATGSGRSIADFHLTEAMAMGAEHLITFGGHAAAAGLTIEIGSIDAFREKFMACARKRLNAHHLKPTIRLDEVLDLEAVTGSLCQELELFEPCGMGNPRPTLSARNVNLAGKISPMGSNEQHLSFFAKNGNSSLRAVGFGMGAHFNALCDLAASGPFEMAFRPALNTWQGRTSVELRILAFRAIGAYE